MAEEEKKPRPVGTRLSGEIRKTLSASEDDAED